LTFEVLSTASFKMQPVRPLSLCCVRTLMGIVAQFHFAIACTIARVEHGCRAIFSTHVAAKRRSRSSDPRRPVPSVPCRASFKAIETASDAFLRWARGEGDRALANHRGGFSCLLRGVRTPAVLHQLCSTVPVSVGEQLFLIAGHDG
jgi:hypothetical protein